MRYDVYIGHNRGGTDEPMPDVPEQVANVLSLFFDGFTLTDGQGYWQGKPERATVATVYGTWRDRWKVKRAARALARTLEQDAVLVSERRDRFFLTSA